MITQEQYDKLNEGDTVTAHFKSDYRVDEFDVTSKVYRLGGQKGFAGWNLAPNVGGKHWTIIEHIPATPAWHSAQVISAEVQDVEGRVLLVRIFDNWYSPELDDDYAPIALGDVKILVDKDVEL